MRILLLLIEFAFLIVSICCILRKRNIIRASIKKTSIIIEVKDSYLGTFFSESFLGRFTVDCPIVEYLDENGKVQQHAFKKGYDILEYYIGRDLEILIYNNKSDTKIYINSWLYLWYNEIVFFLLSAVFFGNSMYQIIF